MSWLKKLGLVEEVPDQKKEENKDVKPADAAPIVAAVAPTTVIGTGSANDELATAILETVKVKSDLVYFKLKSGIETMMASKVDRRNAVIGAAAILGMKGEDVGNVITEMIGSINREQEAYASSIYAAAKQAADNLTAQSNDLQAQINSLLEQVKQLSEQNVNTQQEASRILGEAEVQKATFDATATKLVNTLTAEKQEMMAYMA